MDHEAISDLFDERLVMLVCGLSSLSARKLTLMQSTSV
jgi:hypothetical protein